MLELSWRADKPLRVLCMGAHSDDIEIGCGGTLLRLIAASPAIEMRWVIFSASPLRRQEALDSAGRFLQGIRAEVSVADFRDGFFPYVGGEIKEYVEQIRADFRPNLIFTHYRNDRHQDHRVISDLAWNTFRSHLILEYEIPKYDGDMGVPNVFVPLDEAVARRKVEYLFASFQSQHSKQWFTEETFYGLMRLRGIEAGDQTRYAEAFYGRKLLI